MTKTVIITGISGTLGQALGKQFIRKGWNVVGVTRNKDLDGNYFSEICTNDQINEKDANILLDYNPDMIILNAGQIETEIGEKGEPLTDMFNSINTVNYLFPSRVALELSRRNPDKKVDVVMIGSIADGSPSCFGPLYHASKIAIHYFVSGVGPIVNSANSNIRIRLYRPGAIKGPLSWAPVNRLNDSGYKIREKRCNSAPDADRVARKIMNWIVSGSWIGTYEEPFSFKIFKYLFVLAPNFFYRLQVLGWRKGSKFV